MSFASVSLSVGSVVNALRRPTLNNALSAAVTTRITTPLSSFSSHTIPRVAPCTIHGVDLRQREIKLIKQYINFFKDEIIEIIYLYSNQFEKSFNLENNIIVCITNYRLFKYEKNKIDQIFIYNINSVLWQQNGIFHWDKIICIDHNGYTEEFGIYGGACEYFVNYIQMKIRERPQLN